eukprot:1161188-Pelagomonas_calceolata.AAC.11
MGSCFHSNPYEAAAWGPASTAILLRQHCAAFSTARGSASGPVALPGYSLVAAVACGTRASWCAKLFHHCMWFCVCLGGFAWGRGEGKGYIAVPACGGS